MSQRARALEGNHGCIASKILWASCASWQPVPATPKASPPSLANFVESVQREGIVWDRSVQRSVQRDGIYIESVQRSVQREFALGGIDRRSEDARLFQILVCKVYGGPALDLEQDSLEREREKKHIARVVHVCVLGFSI